MRSKGLNLTKPEEYKDVLYNLTHIPSLDHDDSFIRTHYVRYADDFIIGVEGSYKITSQILDEVKNFLKNLDLSLNESKTRITKYNVNPVEFLGYTIMGPNLKGIEKQYEIIREPNSGRLITRRKKIRIRIAMNYDKIITRLISNGFIKRRILPNSNDKVTFRGTFKGNLINLDHADILRFYSLIIRGIYNYYKFVSNMKQVAYVIWLIEESCCLTLARKFKLKSMKKVYQKFGKDLGCNIMDSKGNSRRVSLYTPSDYKRKPIIDLGGRKDPFKSLDQIWNLKFTKSNLFQSCIVCGSNDNVEMHHVRAIRDLKNPEKTNKDFFTRQMAAINRKQVPLCKHHHICLHNNTLTNDEILNFTKYKNRKN
jgi:hypothetical protein